MTQDLLGRNKPNRADPGRNLVKLTAAMVSDTEDLASPAKAFRIYNGSSAAITMIITGDADEATSGVAVPITVPAGMMSLEPFGARRIWSTGSTGLVAALTAGTVEVVLAIV